MKDQVLLAHVGGTQHTYEVVANKRFRSTWLRQKLRLEELSFTCGA